MTLFSSIFRYFRGFSGPDPKSLQNRVFCVFRQFFPSGTPLRPDFRRFSGFYRVHIFHLIWTLLRHDSWEKILYTHHRDYIDIIETTQRRYSCYIFYRTLQTFICLQFLQNSGGISPTATLNPTYLCICYYYSPQVVGVNSVVPMGPSMRLPDVWSKDSQSRLGSFAKSNYLLGCFTA